jgi:hypothetical protein
MTINMNQYTLFDTALRYPEPDPIDIHLYLQQITKISTIPRQYPGDIVFCDSIRFGDTTSTDIVTEKRIASYPRLKTGPDDIQKMYQLKCLNGLIKHNRQEQAMRIEQAIKHNFINYLIHMPMIITDIQWIFKYACIYGNMQVLHWVYALLETHQDRIEKTGDTFYNVQDEQRNYCFQIISWNMGLCEAHLYHHQNVIEEMVKRGADHWEGALEYACLRFENMELVKALIKNHNIKYGGGESGNDIVGCACSTGNMDLVLLVKHLLSDDNVDLLKEACEGGNKDIIQLFIHGNVNNGLVACREHKKLDIAEWMVSLGATDFDSLLSGACKYNNLMMVQYAVEHGAKQFYLPFHVACAYGYLDIVKYLFPLCDKYDLHRGLMTALEKTQEKCALYLIQEGVQLYM